MLVLDSILLVISLSSFSWVYFLFGALVKFLDVGGLCFIMFLFGFILILVNKNFVECY
jgi:hypothetical protein